MASNRDALAGIIAGSPGVGEYDGLLVAGRIARAGWRPPARVIEGFEEIDALPVGTVIYSAAADEVYRRTSLRDWQEMGSDTCWFSDEFGGKVTVLHEPEEGQ